MTGPKRAFCYTRVSTDQQNTKAQEAELRDYVKRRGWTLKKVYCDKISGMKDVRPGLTGLMSDCRKGQGVSSITVAQMLGHSSTQIVPRYAQVLDQNRRDAVRKMEAHRQETIANGGEPVLTHPGETGNEAKRT